MSLVVAAIFAFVFVVARRTAPRRRLGLISGPGLEVRPAVRRTEVREALSKDEAELLKRARWCERWERVPRASATPCEVWERRRPR